MPKVALFLGAGASKAFDYPTTLDFVGNLKKVLDSVEKLVFESILKSPDVLDIEHVLQKLDPIVNVSSDDYIKEIFRASEIPEKILGLEMKSNIFFSYCENLKQSIINELYIQYEFDTRKIEKIVGFYDELHSILDLANNEPELHVFTTNYDSVFERYCDNTTKPITFTCGFRSVRGGREYWHSEWLKNWKSEQKKRVRLYKLHGSLDWRETANNRIERVLTEDRVPSRSQRYKRNIVIYPAQKNYALEEPFRRLYRYFEEVLNQHDLCLVIGFSFRDPLINNAFLDFLRADSERRLVVVSPNALRDIKENLLGGEIELIEQITEIPMRFGKTETSQAIGETLTRKYEKKEEENKL